MYRYILVYTQMNSIVDKTHSFIRYLICMNVLIDMFFFSEKKIFGLGVGRCVIYNGFKFWYVINVHSQPEVYLQHTAERQTVDTY